MNPTDIVLIYVIIFFFNDTATTEFYTLSLHDALPIWARGSRRGRGRPSPSASAGTGADGTTPPAPVRSEEHTSELQSHVNLVCRLLLEKKKTARASSSWPTSTSPNAAIS